MMQQRLLNGVMDQQGQFESYVVRRRVKIVSRDEQITSVSAVSEEYSSASTKNKYNSKLKQVRRLTARELSGDIVSEVSYLIMQGLQVTRGDERRIPLGGSEYKNQNVMAEVRSEQRAGALTRNNPN